MQLEELAEAIEDRSARGIAAAIGYLIRTGALAPASRLPTVREVAARLGVSPSTVSEAWQALARAGAIETRGKAGTFVRSEAAAHGPERYQRITQGPGSYLLDLSTGVPDAALLPGLDRLLPVAVAGGLTTNYLDDPVDPDLGRALRQRWPFEPERITVVDGCLDAIQRVMTELVRFGDRVVVENPTFPPVLDLLGDLGAQVIAVDLDDHGPVPASLAEALALAPVALFLQPRCQNPTGSALTPERGTELAALLDGTGVVVVEDDHAGDASSSPLVSLGRWLPSSTVHISGFSKSHGPDLRLAAVGGASAPIDAVVSRRRLGPGWSSRILQRLLSAMLVDPATIECVERARTAYAERRTALADALADRGLATGGHDGIYLWVPVRDETTALVYLASRGIGASPGTPFEVAPLATHHIRLTAGLVASGVEHLADAVAVASDRPPAAPRRP